MRNAIRALTGLFAIASTCAPVEAYEISTRGMTRIDLAVSAAGPWYIRGPLPNSKYIPGDAYLVVQRIDYEGGSCADDPSFPIHLLDLQFLNPYPPETEDVPGTQSLDVRYQPDSAKVTISANTMPLVEGTRSAKPFFYTYPLLDRVNVSSSAAGPAQALLPCVRGRVYHLESAVLFSAYNTIVQIRQVGGPVSAVYISPARFGAGKTIMEALQLGFADTSLSGSGSSLGRGVPVPNVAIYKLYYRFNSAKPQSTINFFDSFNLGFGAKAFPVKSPTWTAGTNATAAIGVSTLPVLWF